jgi:hypothetical protein
MNRQSLNLLLAGAALALGGAIVLSQKKEPQKDPLTALSGDAIHHITLEHAGKPTITLEKLETAPVNVEADPLTVNTLLGVATAPAKSRLDVSQVKLADIGLAPPLLTLHLDDTTVTFGGTEPLKYLRYVQVGSSAAAKLALIEDINGPAFDDDYSDLVVKSLLPGDSVISRIELPGLTVSLGADGKTWEAQPATNADQPALQGFVDRWRHAQAMWLQPVPAEAVATTGTPVTITTQNSAVQLTVSARDPQLQIDNPTLKVRYVLSKADADTLLKLPEPPKPEAAKSEPATPASPAAEVSPAPSTEAPAPSKP